MQTNSTSCWESVNGNFNILSLLSGQHNVDTFRMENRLKEIRLKAGLTQDQLGELVGCSGQQIQYLETGKRNLTEKWMKRLAGPLRIMPHELMYENSAEVVEGDKEKALLENFRQMSERDQAVYLASAKAFLAEGSEKPLSTIKSERKRK